MPGKTFLIIDGNSLTHRAFHALPHLTTSDGTITNAALGFTNMLFKMLEKINPDHIAVAFDKGKITFRHESYSEYKANRKATPTELRSQFPLIKGILHDMQIPVLELENYEADDIIGTLTCMVEENNMEAIVLTGDRDILQLVSPKVRVMFTKKGISDVEDYDEAKVWDRYGVSPKQIIDVKGLMGDSSDNIPGVPGIGEKTALKLIQEYGTLENVIASIEILPPRWRNKMTEYKDQAVLSKKLATIECQTPLDIKPDHFYWTGPDYPALLKTFSNLEFKNLLRSIQDKNISLAGQADQTSSQDTEQQPELDIYCVKYNVITTEQQLRNLQHDISSSDKIALELTGTRTKGIERAALAVNSEIYVIPVQGQAWALDVLAEICANPQIKKICTDAKEAMWLLHHHNHKLDGLIFDIQLASYLLNPGASPSTLPDLALKYLDISLPTEDASEPTIAARTDVIGRLFDILHKKLIDMHMDKLYYEIELPLVSVLAEMETDGVAIDPEILSKMAEETGAQIELLMHEIHAIAGEKFNINSPKQLGHILFEKMGLPVIKRTKTGFSTDASVLEELAPSNPIVEIILKYRQLAKLNSTYINGLFGIINPITSRVHTTFHQDVTATGRLSSANPNLQNIPIRLEQGRKIRQVFIPRQKGNLILAADYSQIELRILAHMSQDPSLIEAFKQGQDIHTRTAAEVFNVPLEQVTPELRSRAKAVNFGIVYGISDFGLSRDIKVSKSEASKYIKSYFERYSEVKNFMDMKICQAKENGYTTTMLNRRRYIPDLLSRNRTIKAFGERTAINTPIQGSAADIIKLAMVKINSELKNRGMETKMILQVHDELIFDVPPDELVAVQDLVKKLMENALQLDVPMIVDLKIGHNWYDVRKV